LHVLTAGKSPPPLNEECGDWTAFAAIESATAEISLGAFDKEAARLVVELGPFASLTYCGLIEIVSNLFISCHGLSLRCEKYRPLCHTWQKG
jgi:hypothetical protein